MYHERKKKDEDVSACSKEYLVFGDDVEAVCVPEMKKIDRMWP